MFEGDLNYTEYRSHIRQTYIDIAMELVALQDNGYEEALATVDELPVNKFHQDRIRAEIIAMRENKEVHSL